MNKVVKIIKKAKKYTADKIIGYQIYEISFLEISKYNL